MVKDGWSKKRRETQNKKNSNWFIEFAYHLYKLNAKTRKNSSYKRTFFKKDELFWRKKIFERDGYTCQKCGFIGLLNDSLNVKGICSHHMNNWFQYPEDRFNTDNGITLCLSCHRKIHKGRGRSNLKNNIEFFECNILDIIEKNKKINSFQRVKFKILGKVPKEINSFEEYRKGWDENISEVT